MQQNAPTCTKAGRILFLSDSDPTPTGWAGGPGLHKGQCPFAGWGLQGRAPKPPPCSMGPGQNRNLPGRNPTAMRLARIQPAQGGQVSKGREGSLVDGFHRERGRLPWSWGVGEQERALTHGARRNL
ncbi:MAG: hypothetical protein IPH06_00130 [Alphaproteobacteria bacterium]|nr:hypothetical protein [Alphaproteobacteria bacterium]QQS56489.1 MAG: hypothetical protein IPN28_09380 [Alphaproteobacteria bacterium]